MPPIHTYKASLTIPAFRAVGPLTATAYTVQYPAAATTIPLGVAQDTVKDTGVGIPVAGPGERSFLYFQDSVVCGNIVGADTSGRGVPWTPGADTTSSMTLVTSYLGTLLGPKVDLTGTIAEILICPGLGRGTR